MSKEGKSYADKLKDPRWQKVRLKVMERDGFKCTLCGDEKTMLQVHHEEYSGEPWEAPLDKLKTTCSHCHSVIETSKTIVPDIKIVRCVKTADVNGEYLFVFAKTNINSVGVFAIEENTTRLVAAIELNEAINIFNDLKNG